MSRKKKPEPPEVHPFYDALGRACDGDMSGVHEMYWMFGELCEQLINLGSPTTRLPCPITLARISSVGKESKALAEYANGWARAESRLKKQS